MIGECLEAEREFGIVWAGETAGALDRLRGARSPSVLERCDDGRMNILTAGHAARSASSRSSTTCPTRRRRSSCSRTRSSTRREPDASAARDVYGELVEQATDNEPDADELAEMSAYEMAATVDFGLDAKQGLLDLRSENARLRLVARLLPRRAQAAGLRRARAGSGALEREGPLRLSRSSPPARAARRASPAGHGSRPSAASHEPARISASPASVLSGDRLAEEDRAVGDRERRARCRRRPTPRLAPTSAISQKKM